MRVRVVKKVYDKPKTPYEKVISSKSVSLRVKQKLVNTKKDLSMIKLRNESDKIKLKLYQLSGFRGQLF